MGTITAIGIRVKITKTEGNIMTVTMNTYGNRSQSIQNGRLQYIPRASFVKQRYGIPQYQTLSLQRPNLYPIFQNTHQS